MSVADMLVSKGGGSEFQLTGQEIRLRSTKCCRGKMSNVKSGLNSQEEREQEDLQDIESGADQARESRSVSSEHKYLKSSS